MIYILDASLGDDKIKETIEKFKASIQQKGGEIQSVEMWGRKKLAYPILRKKEGFYVYMNIKCLPSIVNNIRKDFKLTEGLLRMSIIKIE